MYQKLPLIACRTVSKYDIANCEDFSVVSFDSSTVKLRCGTMEKNIEISDVAKYFYPAYCITVHRSQGMTFNEPYTIYEWDQMDEKLKYVALSRGTKKENINFA